MPFNPFRRNTANPTGVTGLGTDAGADLIVSAEGPLGAHSVLASLSTVQTIAVPDESTSVMLQARSQAVHVTLDGTAPVAGTSGTGFYLPTDTVVVLPCRGAASVKAIEDASGGRLQVQFLG